MKSNACCMRAFLEAIGIAHKDMMIQAVGLFYVARVSPLPTGSSVNWLPAAFDWSGIGKAQGVGSKKRRAEECTSRFHFFPAGCFC